MTLALAALVILAIVVFAFVLEPVVRAHSDRAVLDAAALPNRDDSDDLNDDEITQADQAVSLPDDETRDSRRLAIDRLTGNDAS